MTRKHFVRLSVARGMIGAAIVAALFMSARQSRASLLISEWKFDEASGTSASDSVGGFTGSLSAGSAFASGGKIGNRVSLSGSSNVTVSDVAALRPATLSVSTWLKTTDNGAARGIWDKIFNSVGFATFLSSGVASLAVDGSPNLSSGVNVADGSWHNVTGLFAVGQGSRIYVDGVLKASNASASYTGKNTPLAMGGDNASTFLLNGSLDDATVWNVGLTDGEAAALYNLADNVTLNYDGGKADQLFSIYTATTGTATIGPHTWRYMTGLTSALGAVIDDGYGGFYVKLDDAGNGVATPEPASLTLAVFAGGAMLLRRRQSSRGHRV